jgi:hypothetical protein
MSGGVEEGHDRVWGGPWRMGSIDRRVVGELFYGVAESGLLVTEVVVWISCGMAVRSGGWVDIAVSGA